MTTRSKLFTRFAKKAAHFTGTPMCFILALAIIVVWAFTGPVFQFNDTWQLVMVTFSVARASPSVSAATNPS